MFKTNDEEDFISCIYCNMDFPAAYDNLVPKPSDSHTWNLLAHYHDENCEWILTKAHQIDI